MIDLKSFKPIIKQNSLKMVLHGVPGIGKTTFAADLRNPIILACEQKGADTLPVAKAPINNARELMEHLDALLTQEHDFETVVLDTADKLDIYLSEVGLKEFNKSNQTHFKNLNDIPYGKGANATKAPWLQILNKFDELRDKGINICILAHSEIRAVNDISQGTYHMWDVKLPREASNYMCEWADMVLFADVDKHIPNNGSHTRFISKSSPRGASFGDRMIHTKPNGTFRAKNRINLPEKIALDGYTFRKTVHACYEALNVKLEEKKEKIEQEKEKKAKKLKAPISLANGMDHGEHLTAN